MNNLLSIPAGITLMAGQAATERQLLPAEASLMPVAFPARAGFPARSATVAGAIPLAQRTYQSTRGEAVQ